VIGKLNCADITTEHILKILTPIWHVKNETADRVRGRIKRVLDRARAMGLRDGENPANRDVVIELLAPINKSQRVKHHEAMAYTEAPVYAQEIEYNVAISARALLFCILTATRTGETIMATWDEIDLDRGLWIIPRERMKKTREHRVPLPQQAAYFGDRDRSFRLIVTEAFGGS
jgi:integrase